MVFEEAIGILAVASVGGPTRGLNIGDAIRVGPKHAEERFGVHGPCPDFDIIGLLNDAAEIAPIFLQLKDEILKCRAFFNLFLSLDFN